MEGLHVSNGVASLKLAAEKTALPPYAWLHVSNGVASLKL